MSRLLIAGGTMDPRIRMMEAENRSLERFLLPFARAQDESASPGDNAAFRLETPAPYYPFKASPVRHHRPSHTAVMGLAELILEQEAAAVGIPSRTMGIGDLVDMNGNLKAPELFSTYGFLALSTTYLPPAWLFFLLRSIPEKVTIFLGGPGAFKLRDAELGRLRFSYLLRSEAEGRFRDVLRHALGETVDLEKIPGLIWRTGQRLYQSPAPPVPLELDLAPLPDFRAMAAAQGGHVLYESARGCPFRCAFCDYPFLMGNRTFRCKGPERIFEDWRSMCEEMSVTDILCLDSLFTHPHQRLEKLCRLLSGSGLNRKVRWGCYARPNELAREETAAMMREAGCQYVYVGFESGSRQVLRDMNKGCTVEENRKAIHQCRKAGIMTIGLFIAGFPGETGELFRETRDFLRETAPFITSVVPWMPDFTEGTLVPVMQPEAMRRFQLELENPSAKKVVLWRSGRFRQPLPIPWGSDWKHRGMDLQQAWDCIDDVLTDIHEGKIHTLSEEYFLPTLLDDPLNLYRQMGEERAVAFCNGLGKRVMTGRTRDFEAWRRRVGLIR